MQNKSIADTFNARIRSPWAWVVIAVTIGITALFYISQKPQALMYSRYLKTLSDFQLQESFALRTMEQVRIGYRVDSTFVKTQTMTLRELAVSFSREMDEIRGVGISAPSYAMVERFEREVVAKISVMGRYTSLRKQWFASLDSVNKMIVNVDGEESFKIHNLLDSARAGYNVHLNFNLPDSLFLPIENLLKQNEELSMAWNRFDNEQAAVYCDDIIRFFQKSSIEEMSLKSKIPMAFYFLTLVLMLSTFFFIFRSRQ